MHPLEILLHLQRTLARLAQVEAGIGEMPSELAALHLEYDARATRRGELESEDQLAAHEHRLYEAELEDLRVRLTRYQEQIPQLRTQREYAAMLQEMDAAKARIDELEELSLAALERREQAGAELTEVATETEQHDRSYQEALGRWNASKPELEQEAGALRAEVAELRKEVPRQHLSLFNRLYERTAGEPLAAVRRHEGPASTFYHCGACHYQVRFQAVAELRRGELRQCDGCKRILYADDDTAGA